ncbi:MAG: hypothetical protein JKY52_15285 [Flavobacteriales bacterium]|nr:hypothetical protein [Flavobacteriales bacterium]
MIRFSTGYAGGSGAIAEHMRIASTGNVGIGTVSPIDKLHIDGRILSQSAVVGNNGLAVQEAGGNRFWLSATDANTIKFSAGGTPGAAIDDLLVIKVTGDIGIGTATPSAKLDVSGTTSGILIPRVTLVQRNAIVTPVTSELVFQTDNTPGYYYWDGAAWISFLTGSGGGGGWSTTGDAGTTVGTNFLGTTDAQDFAVYTNNAERLRVQSGGNVGIGTTAPVAKLEVDQDNLSIALYVKGGNSGNTLALFERNIGSSERFSIQASNSDVWTRYEVNPGIGTDWNVGVDETNDNFSIWTGLVVPGTTDKLSITPSGNVGIGTTSPGSKLDISGILSVAGGAATDIKLTAGANDWFLSTTNTGLDFEIYRAGQGNIFSIEQNGNVGIGTTSPTAKLQVQFNNSSISDLQFASSLYIKNSSATNNTEASILFGSDPGGRWAGIQAKLTDHTSGSINSDLRFWTVVDNSLGIRMTIKDNGNVGIGTATPAQELDVVGDVQFSAALMPGGNAGTSGQVLTSQGTGLPPVWQAASGGGGIPTEITNEIDGAGNPCVGTGCGVTQNLITCATNCSNLTFNGESDWRVATTVELVNLIPVAPGNTSTGLVWTGVAGPGSTSGRYSLVRFSDAIQGAGTGDLLQTCRCVR